MKFASHLSILSLLIACSARAEIPPYLETAPVTMLWNFNATHVTGTTIGNTPVAIPENGITAIFDPETLRPINRITTEIATPRVFTEENGDQAFFVKQLLRERLEGFATQAKPYAVEISAADALIEDKKLKITEKTDEITVSISILESLRSDVTFFEEQRQKALDEGKTEEAAEAAASKAEAQALYTEAREALKLLNAELVELKSQLVILTAEFNEIYARNLPIILPLFQKINSLAQRLNLNWELTAVRIPQRDVQGLINTPYVIYLTAIGAGTINRPNQHFPTPLSLTSITSLADTSGTTPKVTTYFSVEADYYYATNPLYVFALTALGTPNIQEGIIVFGNLIEGYDYNSDGTTWSMHGSGYMNYSVRKTQNGSDSALVPTKITTTGTGSWTNFGYGGVAPLKILIGEAKLQNRNLFPEFPAD